MSALNNYILEILTARVEFTPGGRSPFKFNEVEDVSLYEVDFQTLVA